MGRLGADGFRPLLLDVIAGRSAQRVHFIGGGMTSTMRDRDGRALHALRSGWWPTLGGMRLVVEIQLFVNMDAPVYHVVVGDPAS